jgi:NADH dehydrogenase FAD-containing subunit
MTSDANAPHILIVGGGYVGMYTALRLQRRLRRGEATITVVASQPNMTYQPFLAEAASGLVEPRQVVVPLRRVLRRCRVLSGEVSTVDHPRRVATVALSGGEQLGLHYDVLVLASGSVSRTLPVPGLAEFGVGFKTVGEAIYLRNQVLSQLDLASSTEDPQRRQRALTFVFVGGGYAGTEALGELEDMARHALRFQPSLSASDMRWVLVEAADRILPELSRSLAEYTVRRLRERGVEVRLETRVESMVDGHVVLSDGERFDAGTVVWTAGVKAYPLDTWTARQPLVRRGGPRARDGRSTHRQATDGPGRLPARRREPRGGGGQRRCRRAACLVAQPASGRGGRGGLGRERRPVRPQEAAGAERERLWQRFAAVSPVDHYQRRTRRPLPVIVLAPAMGHPPSPSLEGTGTSTTDPRR